MTDELISVCPMTRDDDQSLDGSLEHFRKGIHGMEVSNDFGEEGMQAFCAVFDRRGREPLAGLQKLLSATYSNF